MPIIDAKENISVIKKALKIYDDSFPAWEKEDEQSIIKNIKNGKYKMRVFTQNDEVNGLCILDLYGDDYALLSFVAVDATCRGQGIGSELCKDAISFFEESSLAWLMIEGEHRQALLYQKLGFKALDFDYAIPAYDSKKSIKINLLYMQKQKDLNQEKLKEIIKNMFTCGYALSEDDERLLAQLKRVPDIITTKEIK